MVAMPTTTAKVRATPYREPAVWDLARVGGRLATTGYAVSQVMLLGLLWVGYGMARHLTDGQTAQAHANAAEVWAFERAASLPGEDAVQRLVLDYGGLVTFSNWFYVGVHFPMALLFGVWVFVRHRDAWVRVRNVVVLTTAAALVVHVLYPLAPPRFLPETVPGLTLVDTGAAYGPSPYAKGSGLANQFAAMPSLHVGWALIEAWGVVTILRARARWLALAQPIVTFAVVVVTANHYWLDGIVAFVLVCGAIGVATLSKASGDHVRQHYYSGRYRPERSPIRAVSAPGGTLVREQVSPRRGRGRGEHQDPQEGTAGWRRSAEPNSAAASGSAESTLAGSNSSIRS